MTDEYPPFIGNIEAHKKFIESYPKFCDALPGIVELTDRVTINPNVEDADPDRQAANVLMVELAKLSFEDFDEVVLLCANNHPRGALKILRGLFERSVTLLEINKNPASAKLFYEYTHIDRFKLATQMEREFPGKFFTPEKLAEIKAARDAVKDNYTGNSWIQCGIVELARQNGLGGSILIHAYYDALHETHPKMGAIFGRHQAEADPAQADTGAASLEVAHFLVLESVRAMKERFGMNDLEELYQKCIQEYGKAWRSK